ncbi:hypothetical protein GCM10009639_19010 [Kitasatospora putterlickiae]|uniref:Uncharacterized protein n=1 Tax=Kitasatospora putterlickiae TaxID=221725 RepID=A0ABP4IGN8_9ACTN
MGWLSWCRKAPRGWRFIRLPSRGVPLAAINSFPAFRRRRKALRLSPTGLSEAGHRVMRMT